MRLLATTCASALLFTLPAVAQNALIYLTGSSSATDGNPPTSLTPSEARLVIAQRLGLSRYHSLNDATDHTLRAINSFTESSQSLFSSNQDKAPQQAFVLVEGLDAPQSFLEGLSVSPLTLSTPPSSGLNGKFVDDLKIQYITEHGTNSLGDLVMHDTSLLDIAIEHGSKGSRYDAQLDIARKRVQEVLSRKNIEVTIVLTPRTKAATGSWGSYSKVKRQHISATEIKGIEEEEMNMDSPDSPSRPLSVVSVSEDDEMDTQKSNISTKPPRGILPYCFKSMDACKTTTHSCSGHGECVKKYTDETSGSTKESCYSCSCSTTRESRGNGVYKTTQWAGPACQKKDVSVPFWLLGSTTVALVFAVGWGMSLLYAMGSEDLPSVIGAGVSNTGARGK